MERGAAGGGGPRWGITLYKNIKVKQNSHMFQRKGRFRPTDPPMPNVNIKKLVPRF